jgi:SAM-dependent MidA family methyltransferase
MPARPVDGVIVANELLDNLAFEVLVRTERGWSEVRLAIVDDRLVEVLVPTTEELQHWVAEVQAPVGTRLPVAVEVVEWIVGAAASLRRGSMILLDYVAPWSELVERDGGWLRTYADHSRGEDPLAVPGAHDITIDVPHEMVMRAAHRVGLSLTVDTTQADWLRGLGIDALVEEGRHRWEANAATPDLEAIAGRSRAAEAGALTASPGLGDHTVLVFTKP